MKCGTHLSSEKVEIKSFRCTFLFLSNTTVSASLLFFCGKYLSCVSNGVVYNPTVALFQEMRLCETIETNTKSKESNAFKNYYN